MAAGEEVEQLHAALAKLLQDRANLLEAGPKAVLTALQAEDARFATVSQHKCKRALQAVKAEIANREAKRMAIRGTAHDCPQGHGLARFITSHASFCCDVCRVYQPIGSAMWGCRRCDFDVCEARCRSKGTQSIDDLGGTLASLDHRAQDAEKMHLAEAKSSLAQIEAEVQSLEKALDSMDFEEMLKLQEQLGRNTTEEKLRAERRSLLKSTETLLQQIEGKFSALKLEEPNQNGDAQEPTAS